MTRTSVIWCYVAESEHVEVLKGLLLQEKSEAEKS